MGRSSSHAAGSTISAGLPNISGTFKDIAFGGNRSLGGALTTSSYSSASMSFSGGSNTWTFYYSQGGTFNASRSSSIYGNSSTVQPAAYYVYIWRRKA